MQERDYITRYQNGDFSAFGSLYDLYIDQIFAYVLRKTSQREVAEDLTSQIWMKALKGIENFETQEGASFKSWIYTIAANMVIDYYRSAKEQVQLDDIAEMGISENIGSQIDNKDTLAKVLVFLKNLKPIEEEIVILKVWDELSYKEIAEITGKKEDNCKQIYKRTLEKIQANVSLLIILIFFI
ncbi:RNA polymerase sigma factor [Candidatus Gracilibacteria bacterium]|nr:RNA polymerase sigma factor [Candidatus Gracilibacteria bacterium]